jgi:hypothetical protein
MGKRNKEPPSLRILKHEHFLFFIDFADFDALESSDAVFGMNDVVAFFEVAEEIARFPEALGLIQFAAPDASSVLMSAEDFRTCEHCHLSRWNGESAKQEA